MSAERLTFVILVGGSALLGLSFVTSLGRPWRSEVPAVAWLQAALAGVTVAFDLLILLVLLAFPVPWWAIALVLAGQDAAFTWRLARLRAARREDRRRRGELGQDP